ncbi:uncharacterized protein BDZ83DRAFT_654570 [Colletotrichum acutatum]|uniref:Uncharacterized protein n=1 Tax=Glomerella acutata TaxID=27357 RepID=A0AAD8UHK1_GLOAC|nr:uncharacterized protein BDZ83DRAFT_654570 [Colletotrichum acutatum]KAK1720273.1 hypothetical protein BDZ83DRAFT_654570 [Colletotrichum acutatum]
MVSPGQTCIKRCRDGITEVCRPGSDHRGSRRYNAGTKPLQRLLVFLHPAAVPPEPTPRDVIQGSTTPTNQLTASFRLCPLTQHNHTHSPLRTSDRSEDPVTTKPDNLRHHPRILSPTACVRAGILRSQNFSPVEVELTLPSASAESTFTT